MFRHSPQPAPANTWQELLAFAIECQEAAEVAHQRMALQVVSLRAMMEAASARPAFEAYQQLHRIERWVEAHQEASDRVIKDGKA